MKSVLFVDDEPNLLQGLRRMLRPMRDEWTMEFALGPDAALELLERGTFDVVVSDMRMPGMDGAALLEQVRARDPGIARIILSGQTERQAALRATGVAHQFLAKPCNAEDLKSAILRSCELRGLMSNESIRRTVSGIRTLPSLPEIYAELTAELASEEMSLQRVGQIVGRDVALTAKLLQLVNSAFFGLPRRTESVSQAVALLGGEIVRSLALSTAVFKSFAGDVDEFHLRTLWDHSTAVAAVASALTKSEDAAKLVTDDALQAGMLHDVGRLVLAAAAADEYRETIRRAETYIGPLHELERQAFGCDHAQIGGYLLGLWGLPDAIVEAVAYHHRIPATYPVTAFSALQAVHAANHLVTLHDLPCGPAEGPEPAALAALAGDEDRAQRWTAVAARTLDRAVQS